MIKKAQNYFVRGAIQKLKKKKSDYNVFDQLLVRGLFSFCPSLTLFSFLPHYLYIVTLSIQLVRKCSQKCFSIIHLRFFPSSVPIFFIISLSSCFSSSSFFSFFHLLAHTTTKMTAKISDPNFCKKKCKICNVYFVLFEVFCPCIFSVPFAPNFDGYN